MGKHVDKLEWDARGDIHTLPVLLGEKTARVATLAMFVAFYAAVVVLAAVGWITPFALVSLVGVERLVRVWGPMTQPRPEAPPKGFPVWPLWYAPIAFVHARRAGALLLAGLAAGAIWH
jgi:1,4-dihydroxy-2-naphthoate octaprenyltransferase